MADQIRHTRSCADTHNQTTQYPHCGRCSQCIDRRFAVLAAGLDAQDPGEAYRCDLMEGARSTAQDKEFAMSYLRNALFFETAAPEDLVRRFPTILAAVTHTGEPTATSLPRLAEMLVRHGQSVSGAMRSVLEGRRRSFSGSQLALALWRNPEGCRDDSIRIRISRNRNRDCVQRIRKS
jgi:hypothetical protein